MLEISGDWWYYDKDTNMIWASHNSSGILDTNIATLTDSNFDANNGRLIAVAPEMYELLKECMKKIHSFDDTYRRIEALLNEIDGGNEHEE